MVLEGLQGVIGPLAYCRSCCSSQLRSALRKNRIRDVGYAFPQIEGS
jgi:hypothetical protein